MGMRVAMACPRFPPHTGGTETHVDEVSRRLARRGIEVTVLTTEVPGVPSCESRDGVEVRRFGRLDRGDWYVAPGIARVIGRERFDLVHVQGIHTAVPPVALKAAHRRGLPTVVTFHTGGHSGRLRNALRGLQWRALRPTLRLTDRLVAVCEYEIELFARSLGLPPSRFCLIRNGADPLPVDPEAPSMRGDPLVLSVARLERYKGHRRLIEAMPELRRRAPGAHLGIVGKGPDESELRRMVRRLGLEDCVSFRSFTPDQRGQLGALVASADVVALLSDYEAHPVSVMEALALGVPVVLAEGSGLSELARAGLARSVPASAGPRSVAEALLAAREQRGCSSAVPPPGWDDCTDRLAGLYRTLVEAA